MSLAHITLDVADDLKGLILRLWQKRRLEFGDCVLELQSSKTVITVEGTEIHIEPPLKISGKVLGPIRAATTVTCIKCDPLNQTITIDLNHSPIDVKII